jgi:predicted phosphodiesterase
MTYSVAVLNDIHGNMRALEAVLAEVKERSPDLCVFGGDLFENGPRPGEVLTTLLALGWPTVLGNTDQDVAESPDWPAAVWAREQVGKAGMEFIRGLPLSCRVTPPGGTSPRDDLLVVHSTPRSHSDLLLLELRSETTSFTHLTPEPEAVEMLAGVRASLIVYGHIHYFSQGTVAGQRVASIGSVGFPFDSDCRAAYGLVRWEDGLWAVEPVRVPYDYEAAAREIETSGQPLPWRYARMIREAAWLPSG